MDFNATIDLIIRELEEARDIIDDLKSFPGSPVLQIELAKSKCRNAAEVIALIKEYRKIETSVKPTAPEPVKERSEESKKAVLQEIESIMREIDDSPEHPGHERPVIAEIEEPKAVIRPEQAESRKKEKKKEREETLELADEEDRQGEAPEKENNEEATKPFVAPIIADTFSHLASRFGEADDEYGYGRKLSNLDEAIGINDRFYYIREIFEGNRDVYQQTISSLEKAMNLEEAKTLLMKNKSAKADSLAVKQLLDLVRRKFQE